MLMDKFLCEHIFSVLLRIYQKMELLGCILLLTFWGIAKVVFKVTAPFYISSSNVWGVQFLHILINTFYYRVYTYIFIYHISYIFVILVGMKWHVIVLLISVSLMPTDVEHLFMCLFPIRMSSLEKHLFKFFAHFNCICLCIVTF